MKMTSAGTKGQSRAVVGVGGSFHSERLSLALQAGGFDVHLYPTLPKFRFHKFEEQRIHPILFPEVVMRLGIKVGQENFADLAKMRLYGRELAKRLMRDAREPNYLFCWSSFGLEAFQKETAAKKFVMRDSAHILTQNEILSREFEKRGLKYPNRKICEERELAEYEMADRIIVLSHFAKDSFVKKGVPEHKLAILPLATDTSVFFPGAQRKLKLPLQAVYFGNISLQKGVPYLLEAMAKVSPQVMQLELIGTVTEDFRKLKQFRDVKVTPAKSHKDLADVLRTKDVFLFPSLHDGFGAVVPQAMASGLIPVVTGHCGAADLIQSGKNGLIMESGSVDAILAAIYRLTDDLSFTESLRRTALQTMNAWTWHDYEERVLSIVSGSHSNLRQASFY